MSGQTVLIRADASVPMGTGHVMRCLALAQSLQDRGVDVVFVMAQSTPSLDKRLQREGFKVVYLDAMAASDDDSEKTGELARAYKAKWLVVDGYQFGGEYQLQIKRQNLRLLSIDDNGEGESYLSDLVVNQNIHASVQMYSRRKPYTRLLLGTRYAMLRREFAAWRDWKREIPVVGNKLLVTMGGSDPKNLSGEILELLISFRETISEAVIVVGGSNPHINLLEKIALRSQSKVRLERDVDNMAGLMAWADMAISAAGSTCWEMCLLGLPAIVLDVAPNQSRLASELYRLGVAVHLDPQESTFKELLNTELRSLSSSAESRNLLSLKGRQLVDGRGAARVATAMLCDLVAVRRAGSEDCRLLWNWANDPQVRAASFQSAMIPWELHVSWFGEKLRDPNCIFLIGNDSAGSPIGQIRFDRVRDSEFEVSISIDPAKRGLGLGQCLMEKAMEGADPQIKSATLHAFVKPQNQGSIRLFTCLGFQKLEELAAEKYGAIHFVRTN
jgi:UDP-2,4-diacetamido-2,4,6-trideoxy-beta-L-altropyranose hydrolase